MYMKDGKFYQCCQETSKGYRNAYNDLLNLVPAVNQLNGLPSNKPFAEKVSGKKEQTFRGEGRVLVVSSVFHVETY